MTNTEAKTVERLDADEQHYHRLCVLHIRCGCWAQAEEFKRLSLAARSESERIQYGD